MRKKTTQSLLLVALWGLGTVMWVIMVFRRYQSYVAGIADGSDLILPVLNVILYTAVTIIHLKRWRLCIKEEQTDLDLE